MFGLLILIACCVPAAIILAGHWFPWPSVLGRQLSRLEAYAFGVATIYVVPLALFGYVTDQTQMMAIFLISATSAGVATLAAWGIDQLVERYHRLQDEKDAAESADE